LQVLAFFTDAGVPKTGLVPTVRIRDISDNTLVITDSTSSEVGDGWYKYDFIAYDSDKEYAIRFDGGPTLSDSDRYTSGTNDSFADDITNGVWSENLSTYDTGAGKMQQLQVFDSYIRIDTTAGYSGITFPIGTYKMPSNNLTDALTIAANNNIAQFRLRSDLTIEAGHDITDKSFETHGIMGTNLTFESGCAAQGAAFRYLNLQGTLSGVCEILVENCSILNLENFTGIMQGVSFAQGSEISIGTWAEIYNCRAGGEPGNEPEISIGNSILSIQQYRGNLKLTNKTGDNRTVASFLPGNVTIADTCVAGKIQILGIGEVEADDSGPGCQVDLDAVISRTSISESVWDEPLVNHVDDQTTGHALLHESYDNTIFVDPINGTNGSVYPFGIRQHPVKNITDILAVSANYNLSKVHVLGSLTINGGEDISGFTFISDRSLGNIVTIIAGATTNGTYFENLTVSGTMNGAVRYTTSVLGTINNFDGGAKNCLLTGNLNITGNGANYLTDCDTYVTDATLKQIDVGDKLLNIIRCRGNYEIINKTSSSIVTIDLFAGHIKIASSCVSGIITVSGLVRLIDESSAGCYVIDGTMSEAGTATEILDRDITLHSTENSLGLSIQKTLGLLHENIFIDNSTYDDSNNLISARVRIYSNAVSVGTTNNVIGSYAITSVGDGPGKFVTWKQVKS
jgi:hypothetical protein